MRSIVKNEMEVTIVSEEIEQLIGQNCFWNWNL